MALLDGDSRNQSQLKSLKLRFTPPLQGKFYSRIFRCCARGYSTILYICLPQAQCLVISASSSSSRVSVSDCPPLAIDLPEKPKHVYLKGNTQLRSLPYHNPSDISLQQCCVISTQKQKHQNIRTMALTKSQRIMILLAIDTAFFFVELIVGMLTHYRGCKLMLIVLCRLFCTLPGTGCRRFPYVERCLIAMCWFMGCQGGAVWKL